MNNKELAKLYKKFQDSIPGDANLKEVLEITKVKPKLKFITLTPRIAIEIFYLWITKSENKRLANQFNSALKRD